MRASFAIGFCILFAFIGTFTYVNFVLVREPLSLSRMALGFVYFVFLPSVLTTPLAGRAVQYGSMGRTQEAWNVDVEGLRRYFAGDFPPPRASTRA